MKNSNSFSRRIMALKFGRWLPLVMVFFLGSCQKENDFFASGDSLPANSNQLVESRTSDVETHAVAYAKLLLTNSISLSQNPQIYEDLKAGQFTSSSVSAQLGKMGYNSFGDFANKMSANVSFTYINQALSSGTLTKEALIVIWKAHQGEIETAMRQGPSLDTPCYDQLIHDLAFVAIEVGIAASAGPWAAAAAGAFGVVEAYIHFKDCLDENYG